MKSKFIVFNSKHIKRAVYILMSILGIIVLESSGVFTDKILETANTNRLLPIYSVETDRKQVAITFDCAWGADDIPDIIKTLTDNGVTATFFMVGDWINKYPDAVKLMYENNMELGNHSDSHAHVNQLSYEKNIEDMQKCNSKIKDITGGDIKFYRGPYGEYNNTVIQAADSVGMKVIQWDIDTLDYTGKTANEMCERIKSKIRNGSIILMHNDTKYTANGLQQIIDCIDTLEYEIVPLSDLIYFDNYEINHEGRQIAK